MGERKAEMENKKINRYSLAFKERAIALAGEIGCSRAARILGIKTSTLQYMCDAKTLNLKNLSPKSPEERAAIETAQELKKLRKENEELKKANLILREVASVFSKDPLPTSLGWSEISLKKRQQ